MAAEAATGWIVVKWGCSGSESAYDERMGNQKWGFRPKIVSGSTGLALVQYVVRGHVSGGLVIGGGEVVGQ